MFVCCLSLPGLLPYFCLTVDGCVFLLCYLKDLPSVIFQSFKESSFLLPYSSFQSLYSVLTGFLFIEHNTLFLFQGYMAPLEGAFSTRSQLPPWPPSLSPGVSFSLHFPQRGFPQIRGISAVSNALKSRSPKGSVQWGLLVVGCLVQTLLDCSTQNPPRSVRLHISSPWSDFPDSCVVQPGGSRPATILGTRGFTRPRSLDLCIFCMVYSSSEFAWCPPIW